MSKRIAYVGLVVLLIGLIWWVFCMLTALMTLHWVKESGEAAASLGYNWFRFYDYQEMALTMWSVVGIFISFIGFTIAVIGTYITGKLGA